MTWLAFGAMYAAVAWATAIVLARRGVEQTWMCVRGCMALVRDHESHKAGCMERFMPMDVGVACALGLLWPLTIPFQTVTWAATPRKANKELDRERLAREIAKTEKELGLR